MDMMSSARDLIKEGERTRLIPVIAESRKEQRITASFLAVLSSVDEYGQSLLKSVGAPVGKTSKISCFTEVRFKAQDKNSKARPDGLIYVETRGKIWTAIVEAKVGNAALDPQQIEAYVQVARDVGVDAVITISNQFASLPDHHPVKINKMKLRSVDLFHWSWTHVLTEAVLHSDRRAISDPDQAYILDELIRCLRHESSGVSKFERMPTSWKDICGAIHQGGLIARTDVDESDVVGAWHELVRFIALDLSAALGRSVSLHLSRKHASNPEQRLHDNVSQLVDQHTLSASLVIPDAASRLMMVADFARRSVSLSMVVDAPQDIQRSPAAGTWLLRQLDEAKDANVLILARWPSSPKPTFITLAEMREDRSALFQERNGLVREFEIRQVHDLGGRFRGARTFVDEIVNAVPGFYAEFGEHLVSWVPKPPKITTRKDEKPAKQTFTDVQSDKPEPSRPIAPEQPALRTNEALLDIPQFLKRWV